MIQTCHLKKIKAATRNEQFFVFSSPAVDPKATYGGESLFLRKLFWASLPNKRQKLRDH
jgi:hypothetical protein